MKDLPRITCSLFGGAAAAFCVFWLMQRAVLGEIQVEEPEKERPLIDFVRTKKELKPKALERAQPQKPKLPPKLTKHRSLIPALAAQISKPDISVPNYKLPIMLEGNAAIEGFGAPASGLIPVVYIPPQYPFRALHIKKEGLVELEFTVTETGSVSDIKVLKARPPGYFEDAAVRAISRWKFKPKTENGKAVTQRAVQTINFSLD